MKNPILNLLFSYKGSIDNRQYLIGLVILFLVAMFSHGALYILLIEKSLIHFIGSRVWFDHLSLIEYILSSYLPNVLPVDLLFVVSLLFLSIKRVRAFNKPILLGVFAWIFSYFFFKVLAQEPTRFIYLIREMNSLFHLKLIQEFKLYYIIATVVGLGVIAFLYFNKSAPAGTPVRNKRGFNSENFVLELGKIHLVIFLLSTAIYFIDVFASSFYKDEVLAAMYFILIFAAFLGLSIWYVGTCFKRLRSCGYNPYYAVAAYFIVLILFILCYMLMFWDDSDPERSLKGFLFLNLLYLIGQLLPFILILLPDQRNIEKEASIL